MSLSAEEQVALVAEARSGPPDERERAHRRLLEDFRPFAMAVIHRTLAAAGVGHDHAEEAWLQASFRLATVGLARFAGEASPRTYFLRIALHAAVDVVREVLRRSPPADDATVDPERERIDEERQRREIEALRACLDALPAEYRDAVRLYYLEEAGSCAVCAGALRIGVPAFMKRLERARGRLERCVRGRLAQGGAHA